MLTTIKLTNRIDIDKNNIQVICSKVKLEDGIYFPKVDDISYSFDHVFPVESRILIRFKLNHHTKTLDCGTLENIQIPPVDALSDMIAYDMDLRCVFCVVDPISNKILGSNKLFKYIFHTETRPEAESQLTSISPIAIDFRDTGERLWEIDHMNQNERFVKIFFNDRIQNKDSLKKSQLMANMYLPEILHKMILFIIDNNLGEEERSKETWVGKVNLMLAFFNMNEIPSSSDTFLDKEDFISRFISHFLFKNRNSISINSISKLDEVLSNE